MCICSNNINFTETDEKLMMNSKSRLIFSIIASAFIMSQAIAADNKKISRKMGDGGISIENNKATFFAATNKLKIPIVHYTDANGNTVKTLFAAELELSKNKSGEAKEFKVIKLDITDEYGCIFPEKWQESMGHCMEQN